MMVQADMISQLTPGVNDGSVPLLEVVKALGEYLVSPDDDLRLKGRRLVSSSTPLTC